MKVVKCTSEGLTECKDALRKGRIIVYPTDTVYGIGCDPFNDAAVKRVFEIKQRHPTKPMPVLVHDLNAAETLVDLGDKGRKLAKKFWPGQLTIVAPLVDRAISAHVTAGSHVLGVRVPANRCLLSLLERCKFLVGTSANLSGRPSPKSARDVLASGLSGFDLLLDGGKVEHGKESTVVDVTKLTIIRKGPIGAEEISDALYGIRE